jgi:hypothetical protein
MYDPTHYGMGSMTSVSTYRPSRLVKCPNPNDWGRSSQPREATKRTTTQGCYLLRVRCPWKLGDYDEDHDVLHIAQDG